jgi:predicted nucleic-acid-binding protein
VDTNILVRHLTGEPADFAARATAFLANGDELLLADLIAAETIYVLESFYQAPRSQIADAMRSLLAMSTIVTIDPALLLRAVEVYEIDRIDFAEAYLVAQAESTGVHVIASFDKSIDRVKTVKRVEPPRLPEPGHRPTT